MSFWFKQHQGWPIYCVNNKQTRVSTYPLVHAVWRGIKKRWAEKRREKIGGVPTSHILLLNCVSYMVRYIFSLSVHYLYRNIMLKTSYLYLSTVVNHLNCAIAVGTSCYIYIILRLDDEKNFYK